MREPGHVTMAIASILAMREIPGPQSWEIALGASICGFAIVLLLWDWAFGSPLPPVRIARGFLLAVLSVAIPTGWAWYCWPSVGFVYVKPGAYFDSGSPNAGEIFMVVVRGPKTAHNVDIAIDDQQRDEDFQRRIASAKSHEERGQIARQEGTPQVLHYDELDPSTMRGMDREVEHFIYMTGNARDLKYDFFISFRGGDVRESLEIRSPTDHLDWQYKMKVTLNGATEINCQDPRFPKLESGEERLPQCFPEYEGKLPK